MWGGGFRVALSDLFTCPTNDYLCPTCSLSFVRTGHSVLFYTSIYKQTIFHAIRQGPSCEKGTASQNLLSVTCNSCFLNLKYFIREIYWPNKICQFNADTLNHLIFGHVTIYWGL